MFTTGSYQRYPERADMVAGLADRLAEHNGKTLQLAGYVDERCPVLGAHEYRYGFHLRWLSASRDPSTIP